MKSTITSGLAACVLAIAAGCAASGDRPAGAQQAQPLLAVGYTAASHQTHQVARAVGLLDGRVLVADWELAEVYDPQANTWTVTGPPAWPYRARNALVRLQDGRVLSCGGGGGGPYVSTTSAEILDPVTLTWTPVAPMAFGREAHSAVLLADGRVLVVGGLSYGAPAPDATAEIYDPATGSWSLAGTSAFGHSNGAATLLPDGRVLVAGFGQPEVFDPATGQFTAVGSSAQARPYGGAALLPTGKVLLFGGDTPTSELFDPAAGTFQATGSLADPKRWNAAWSALPTGQVLVAGGYDVAGHTLASVERYDPADGQWTAQTPLLIPRENAVMVPLSDAFALVVGGVYRSPPPNANVSNIIGQSKVAEVIGYAGPCQPTTCPAVGASCGTVADGCGGILDCGGCGSGQVCSAQHACVCAPPACGARVCGDIPDGCGGTASCGACGMGLVCAPDGSACLPQPGAAAYDPVLRAPVCALPAPSCDSGALLVGRGPVGPEPNAPNVLGGACADASGGVFHSDESLDRLRVSTLDGGPLRTGATVRIEVTVWAWAGYSSDFLDLYYATDATNPVWVSLGTFSPTASGAQVVSTTTVLGAGQRHAVRGVFRYGGSATFGCVAGSFTDRDDLVFAVEKPVDAAPPSVGILRPAQDGMTVSGDVVLEAVASDDVGVTRLDWYVAPNVPGGQATFVGSGTWVPYTVIWNSRPFNQALSYVVLARAYDAAGHEATAARSVVVDNAGPSVTLDEPVAGSTVSGQVTISARASDYSGVAMVSFYDGTTLIATDTLPPYQVTWSTAAVPGGPHTLRAVAVDRIGNASEASVIVNVPGASGATTAAYSPTWRAPECATASAVCDSGVLLNGRAQLGPEANAPNTLFGSCADGTSGVFHSDESLDKLRIETVAGGNLRSGATVKVTASVWSYNPTDVLDVYYAANASAPVWTWVGSAYATKSRAAETLVLTFPLSANGAAKQAIRGVFRYLGARSACPGGAYDDKDDLVFTAQ